MKKYLAREVIPITARKRYASMEECLNEIFSFLNQLDKDEHIFLIDRDTMCYEIYLYFRKITPKYRYNTEIELKTASNGVYNFIHLYANDLKSNYHKSITSGRYEVV